MSYRYEKNRGNGEIELIIDGFDKGISPSPHKGIANMQGVNIATESGEAMCSFGRVIESQVGTTGTLTQVDTDTVVINDGIDLLVGQVITITDDGGTGLGGGSTLFDIVVVGGGAGGGGAQGGSTRGNGGGGAGGYKSVTGITAAVGSYAVTIGLGGIGGTGGGPNDGNDGGDTIFDTTTAHGGGGGGAQTNNGHDGGSGGGAGNLGSAGGVGTSGEGNDGGTGSSDVAAGSGGGGATAVGDVGGPTTGGVGGTGATTSISGSPITYSTGGNGGTTSGGEAGNSAASNTGNGGDGAGGTSGGGLDGGDGGSGIVVVSYPTGGIIATGGTITTSGGNTIHTFTTDGTFDITSVKTGIYYYLSTGKLYSGGIVPSDPNSASAVSGITSGTATFIITYPLGQPYQSATETYKDASNNLQYRYYILDLLGNIWCHDTTQLIAWDTPEWFYIGNVGAGASGLAVLNGWIYVTNGVNVYWKLTVLLGSDFGNSTAIYSMYGLSPRVAVVAQQTLYVSDGNIISTIEPGGSAAAGAIPGNMQTYCQYTAISTDTADITALIGGSQPSVGVFASRVPALFFSSGTLPTALPPGVIYYIEFSPGPPSTFQVYDALSGGSPLDLETGATGKQYFNSFDPTSPAGRTLILFTFEALLLSFYEIITAMATMNTNLIIGTRSNYLYIWNKISVTPQAIIPLPENNTANLITVNSMVYVFAGQKGNIYITNGSAASMVTSVPDYCAGISGTPSSYIEPYFTWGGSMYVRGRVWFSILDQTSTKAGNCGGIWSFVPSENFFYGQDTGLALRIENQSSYGTYDGASPVLLASQQQTFIGAQYWSGWFSSITSPSYGIDFTDTIPQQFIIETDLIPTGTMLQVKTFNQIEYKLSTELAAGDLISVSYRQNSTDQYVSCGTFIVTSSTSLSGYVPMNFQQGQWIQFKIVGTPQANSSSSFCRLKELIAR